MLPAQVQAPPSPGEARGVEQDDVVDSPKARLEAPIRPRPVYRVTRGPARSASSPPGIEPTSVPSA